MMSRSNEEIDRLIRETLARSDAELLDHLEDRSMAELLAETFRGRHRRLAIGGAVVNLMIFAAGVFAAVQFVAADDPRSMILWGGVTLLCFGAVSAIKIWYWLEMNRLAIIREVKRVELQVVQLAEKLSKERSGPPAD
ncbi:MAG: hypothetical protein GWN99_02375 [Gemmatimonadetes bacterium]|uniref:Transmembrane protein n=1 Tax=Candidatus Kutchimonas denitrificans TaxID=3056748 RepID=A0AAE4ZC44_9BACT|nr:hypothetical protein [Gemmatimonadota bacterium]NIR74800.1 hypothetical protein [Candidatus Kutchimonas denitrificans]NIR99911.1 hypothetical protein [Gemmatimonadota bacterium]NIT65495.1 hypothetical protein [Gemmatimonadota bacterium]NIU52465.1 hypothetical protein [Gemmatimonadota bacterium]